MLDKVTLLLSFFCVAGAAWLQNSLAVTLGFGFFVAMARIVNSQGRVRP
jgi:hypothetical protein